MSTFAAPHYTEYASTAPNPPYNGSPVGCVVSATADLIQAYTGKRTTDLSALGTAMGQKCRATYGTKHGLWLQGYNWGTCCAYLELKSHGIRMGYGRLTVAQLRTNLAARKPAIITGLYVSFPLVSQYTYSSVIPAKGRSDAFTGAHGVCLWEYNGRYLLSDADFGSPGRPAVPPFSDVPASAVEGMYASRTWPAAYCLDARPVAAPYFSATVIHNTALYRDGKWVYNGPNAIKAGTALVIRGARYLKGGQVCYPIVGPKYAGYYVPVSNVKLGGIVP